MIEVPASARLSRYDKSPHIDIAGAAWSGEAAWAELARHARDGSGDGLIVIDAYPGADVSAIVSSCLRALPDAVVIDFEERAAKPSSQIEELIAHDLTDDRVFGVMTHFRIAEFFDQDAMDRLGDEIRRVAGLVVVVGWGAALLHLDQPTVVLADMPRWEIQARQRAGAPNWHSTNGEEDVLRKFKRGYFVEWRTADRHKRQLFEHIDYVLDTTGRESEPKLITAHTFREGLHQLARSPFRVVPFFDPGVWGGQWMREAFDLPDGPKNYAWCFDCVPEENSVLLAVDGQIIEVPAIDVVFAEPRALLGELTYARYGAEFPIRFDFLDTMGGGNLSLQVHPLTDYIVNQFGMQYTQDESYYLLAAEPDANVYLGLKTGISPEKFAADLASASRGEMTFPADTYVNRFPARKHDHFSIPAGTVHCSGAGSMVLEISATPYIFTFKMWDWDRLGLDGRPRPVHLDHALANIQWQRDTEWAESNLVDQVIELDSGDGWREEKTGLHALESIEVRRHWFTKTVPHNTNGTVNVLNLVEGAEAIVESPTNQFAPYLVHYAETFIIPASVGPYTIRPYGAEIDSPHATVKAYVRGTEAK